MALAAYRSLLRSAAIAFEGDVRTLLAAKQQIRQSFQANAALAPTDPNTQPAIDHAFEVAKFLRENVVQGTRQEDDKYVLRIHEHTERGDNESIKTAGKGTLGGGGCCGGSGKK
ncbi:hypothetical protein B0T11DRAFT_284960 [Plectosphaerella cucumerina]|uniref:Mitochondrial zinc maintenance protein 1, mitochondrial n=1 Tax=Plectosphaerella cucumerina TaxID=40658 RepID=A0A8K0TBS5_9PEZI|nr:hypothetical protein B0T11DRAFT_284960 [Plectosphaerella cucumerina]